MLYTRPHQSCELKECSKFSSARSCTTCWHWCVSHSSCEHHHVSPRHGGVAHEAFSTPLATEPKCQTDSTACHPAHSTSVANCMYKSSEASKLCGITGFNIGRLATDRYCRGPVPGLRIAPLLARYRSLTAHRACQSTPSHRCIKHGLVHSHPRIPAQPDSSPGPLHPLHECVGLEGGHVLVQLAPSHLTACRCLGRPCRAQARGPTVGGDVGELVVGQLAGGGAAHGPLAHLCEVDGGIVRHARRQDSYLRRLPGCGSGVQRVGPSERYASQPSGPYRGIAAAARHLSGLADDLDRGPTVGPEQCGGVIDA